MVLLERWLYIARLRLRSIVRRDDVEAELSEELQYHLERESEERASRGLDRQTARRASILAMDGVERSKEECRDARGTRWLDIAIQDVRYGARRLAKVPTFTGVAVLTLAAGIGANTIVFSLVNSIILRPPPYRDAHRLVAVTRTSPSRGAATFGVPSTVYDQVQRQSHSFDELAAVRGVGGSALLTGAALSPQMIEVAAASANFFPMLGVRPFLGRAFGPEDERHGSRAFTAPVCILSYAAWQRRFGADPAIVGRAITLSGQPSTILGVMPREFEFRLPYDIWVPLPLTAAPGLEPATVPVLTLYGHLRPGVDLARARSDVVAVAEQLAVVDPQHNTGWSLSVAPLQDFYLARGGTREAFLLVFGIAGLVLLICCANLANLTLVRASSRQRELAVSLALGASRARVGASLLIESLLVSVAGGGAGIALARWSLPPVQGLLPVVPTFRADAMTIDARVLAFASAAALLTTLAFGLLPATQAARPDVMHSLKDGGRSSTGHRDNRLRGLLVVFEFALGVAVVVSASLAIRTLRNLERVEPGLDVGRLLTIGLYLAPPRYSSERDITLFYERLHARLEQVPGVEATAMTIGAPLTSIVLRTAVAKDGQRRTVTSANPQAVITTATPDYFRTLGVALRAGRIFDARDMEPDAPRVVLASESLSQILWPHEIPVGKRISIGDGPAARLATVVGVVGDVHHESLASRADFEIYEPVYRGSYWDPRTLIVRTSARPEAFVKQIEEAIAAVDPDQPQNQASTMDRVAASTLSRQRFSALALGLFGAIALGLAAIGIYGVMSYVVAGRAHEMAIRMALGAPPRTLLSMIIGKGLALAGIGVAIGLAAAGVVGRAMSTLLFGITAFDPPTFLVAPALLVGVALIACYVPARRTVRIDPIRVLRDE